MLCACGRCCRPLCCPGSPSPSHTCELTQHRVSRDVPLCLLPLKPHARLYEVVIRSKKEFKFEQIECNYSTVYMEAPDRTTVTTCRVVAANSGADDGHVSPAACAAPLICSRARSRGGNSTPGQHQNALSSTHCYCTCIDSCKIYNLQFSVITLLTRVEHTTEPEDHDRHRCA